MHTPAAQSIMQTPTHNGSLIIVSFFGSAARGHDLQDAQLLGVAGSAPRRDLGARAQAAGAQQTGGIELADIDTG